MLGAEEDIQCLQAWQQTHAIRCYFYLLLCCPDKVEGAENAEHAECLVQRLVSAAVTRTLLSLLCLCW